MRDGTGADVPNYRVEKHPVQSDGRLGNTNQGVVSVLSELVER